MSMKILFPGIPPSKKNARLIIHNKQGRAFSIPSNEYQKWEKEMAWHVAEQVKIRIGKEGPFHLHVRFFISTKKPWDLSNKIESVQDLLKKCRVIKDDNLFVLQKISSDWKDAESDFTEVTLSEIGPQQVELFKEV